MSSDAHDRPSSPDAAAQRVFAEVREDHERRVAAHAELRASGPFQAEIRTLNALTADFTGALQAASLATTRHKPFENLLAWRFLDDAVESAIAVHGNALNGLHNPARRELRYCVESAVKNLYVDQQFEMDASVEERLAFLETEVKRSSIDAVDEAKLTFFWDDKKPFVDDVKSVYGDLCGYVHVSRRQLEERLRLALKERNWGFETTDELRRLNALISRTYDILLVFMFHGLGAQLTGDVFTQVLDDRKWRFHRTKWVKQVSTSFAYKAERHAPT